MADEMVRFEVGFVGGGQTSGTVAGEDWARVEAALAADGDVLVVVDLDEDTKLWIRPSQISWLRRVQKGSRVGF